MSRPAKVPRLVHAKLHTQRPSRRICELPALEILEWRVREIMLFHNLIPGISVGFLCRPLREGKAELGLKGTSVAQRRGLLFSRIECGDFACIGLWKTIVLLPD